MTQDEMDQLIHNHIGDPDVANAIQYILILQARNDNLSKQYRIAANTAEQATIPLTALRKLNRDYNSDAIDATTFIAGVNYHATEH